MVFSDKMIQGGLIEKAACKESQSCTCLEESFSGNKVYGPSSKISACLTCLVNQEAVSVTEAMMQERNRRTNEKRKT